MRLVFECVTPLARPLTQTWMLADLITDISVHTLCCPSTTVCLLDSQTEQRGVLNLTNYAEIIF